MERFRTAVIGMGYIGTAHIEALQRIGINVCAISDINVKACEPIAKKYGIDKVYGDYHDMIDGESLTAVHICTPNHMHYEIAVAAIKKGIHVFCEKPLALTSKQSRELVEQAKEAGVLTAINYNYRYYPAVQHARGMVKAKKIGEVNIIIGNYLQDWLLYDTDYNWRLEKEIGGDSRAVADIGSHWCDMAQHVSGLKIVSVMADLMTVHHVRKKPMQKIMTFAKADKTQDFEEKPMTTEDYAGVLVRFDNGAKGVFSVSQVSAGQKCTIRLEVYGAEQSVAWEHENANALWVGKRDENCEIVTKSPTGMNEQGARFAHYPAGHLEGYPSVVKNICMDFYKSIENGEPTETLPTFEDGYNQAQIVDAILKSSAEKRWVDVE